MLAVANIVFPVFALIFLGFAFRRTGILNATAVTELNRFVVYLALPALMVDVIVSHPWDTLYQPGFILATEAAVFGIFGPVFLFHWLRWKKPVEASIEATVASYANTGYVGIPLCLLAFGREGLAPAAVSSLLTVSVNFAASIILVETGMMQGTRPMTAIRKVLVSLCRNPLIVTPCVAGLVAAMGISIPHGISQAIQLLGSAACPCALVATGLFLAQKQKETHALLTVELVALKLIVQPLIAWYFAYQVFDMPEVWAKAAVVLSALPTGTGPFMLAEIYQRGTAIASRSILLSTLVSTISVSMWLGIL
jgi:predicted permease